MSKIPSNVIIYSHRAHVPRTAFDVFRHPYIHTHGVQACRRILDMGRVGSLVGSPIMRRIVASEGDGSNVRYEQRTTEHALACSADLFRNTLLVWIMVHLSVGLGTIMGQMRTSNNPEKHGWN